MWQMFTVLFRDRSLIAIDKPAGLLVHRSDIDRHEHRFAVQLLRDQIGQHVQPVHRLDKGTSGVLLFALNEETTRELSARFEQNAIRKTYLAIVRGWPEDSGEIDHPLTRKHDRYGNRIIGGEAQAAKTIFRTLARAELPIAVDRHPSSRYALVELHPHTGRTHQLRRHMKHINHPIIGDATHGKGRHNRFFQKQFCINRLLLACVGLEFFHPVSGHLTTITTTAGEDFMSVVKQLGWLQALNA